MAARQARVALFAIVSLIFAGCSSAQPPKSVQAAIAHREILELQPTVNRYKPQAVMGFDIKGTTLMLSVDAEGWSQLDEATETGLKDSVLSKWARVWGKYHPRQHATLRLLVQNYYGQEITSQTRHV